VADEDNEQCPADEFAHSLASFFLKGEVPGAEHFVELTAGSRVVE